MLKNAKDLAKELSEFEIYRMDHCVGYDNKKVYHRNGVAYFKPYRNYYDPGGPDLIVWSGLKEKGYAGGCKDQSYYWLNRLGLNVLSAYHDVYIYSDNARGNVIDASHDVIETLLEDAVFCGFGCWLPTGSKEIALRSRLPHKLTIETLHYLQDVKGYVRLTYFGECDDEGFPHCKHGWELTEKWKEDHKEAYEAAMQAEYKRIEEMCNGE